MERKQAPINWDKIKVDTPVLVKDNNMDKWVRAHFADFVDGCVYTFPNGLTSHSYEGIMMVGWDEAKIADLNGSYYMKTRYYIYELVATKEQMEELNNHLKMNGYDFSINELNISVNEDEMDYVETIMEDRDISYSIVDYEWK